jgi:hypothetical protein
MVVRDEPTYTLSHNDSIALITAKRKVADNTALRECPVDGCPGWLYPRDSIGEPFNPVLVPTVPGEARAMLEGRCGDCKSTWTWWLTGG